jgi:hypothetical protein
MNFAQNLNHKGHEDTTSGFHERNSCGNFTAESERYKCWSILNRSCSYEINFSQQSSKLILCNNFLWCFTSTLQPLVNLINFYGVND